MTCTPDVVYSLRLVDHTIFVDDELEVVLIVEGVVNALVTDVGVDRVSTDVSKRAGICLVVINSGEVVIDDVLLGDVIRAVVKLIVVVVKLIVIGIAVVLIKGNTVLLWCVLTSVVTLEVGLVVV